MSAKLRIELERRIARGVVKRLVRAGYRVSVDNGADRITKPSTDVRAVVGLMMQTDEDYLRVWHRGPLSSDPDSSATGWRRCGWVRFIYGNEGHDVVNDHTTNLEGVIGGYLERMFDRYC